MGSHGQKYGPIHIKIPEIMEDMPDHYRLTCRDIVEITGVPDSTIYRCIKDGRLPPPHEQKDIAHKEKSQNAINGEFLPGPLRTKHAPRAWTLGEIRAWNAQHTTTSEGDEA